MGGNSKDKVKVLTENEKKDFIEYAENPISKFDKEAARLT